MQRFIIGGIIGLVFGALFGASIVAPRLNHGDIKQQNTSAKALNLESMKPSYSTASESHSLDNTMNDEPGTRVHWNIVSAFPSNIPVIGSIPSNLGEQIAIVSNNDISFVFHEPGTLVPTNELSDAVKTSVVDAALSAPAFDMDEDPALGLFGFVPFGPTPNEMLAWIYDGDGLKYLTSIYNKRKLHPIPCGMISAEAAGWFRQEISSISDISKLRVQIDGLAARTLRAVGAEIVTLKPAQVPGALKMGIIDAAGSSIPSMNHSLELRHSAEYYYFPGWHHQSALMTMLVRSEQWEALTITQQAQISAVCGDNIRSSLVKGGVNQFESLKKISGSGTNIQRLPKEVLTALSEAWQVIAMTEAKNNKKFAEVWESLLNFRRDYNILDELGSM